MNSDDQVSFIMSHRRTECLKTQKQRRTEKERNGDTLSVLMSVQTLKMETNRILNGEETVL